MKIERIGRDGGGAARNVERLAELFPNVVTEVCRDGRTVRAVDFDALRRELGQAAVEGEMRYSFTWPDKDKAVIAANEPADAALRPQVERSSGRSGTPGAFDSANVYIEGDNLTALKLLQETYLGRVKMIYIDPPYNTGNDFVYRDKFAQREEEYLQETGAVGEGGERLVTNPETNGRFHTDWLNMIYPRLRVARNLLSDDGVIFISIDDNEVHNLRKVCDEIFGEENFVAVFPWRKRAVKSDVPFGISQDFEWIVVYAKSNHFLASVEGKGRKYYETPDFPGRPWRVDNPRTQRTASERPNSFFTMVNPKNGKEYPADPNRTWAVTKDTFKKYYAQNKIIFPGDYDFLSIKRPVLRYWKSDDMAKAGDNFGRVAVSTKLSDDIGRSLDGTKEIRNLFELRVFGFPKPVSLIKFFAKIIADEDALILDFFSGSATTAHAVMELNAEDGGNRRFIMVQIPEVCAEGSEARSAGYANICEIGEERIRRAGRKIIEEHEGAKGSLDVGFRVFKIDSPNMKDSRLAPGDTMQGELFESIDNIKDDRTPQDLLVQAMLALGITLDAQVESECSDRTEDKLIFVVRSQESGADDGPDLVACFDEDVSEDVAAYIADKKPQNAVFCDACFPDDSARENYELVFEYHSRETKVRVI